MDATIFDRAFSRQRFGRIELRVLRWSVDTASVLIEHDDVKINLSPSIVAQDEVPGTSIRARNRLVPARLQRGDRSPNMVFLNDDVEVAMAPRLGAEAGVHRPPPIEPDAYAKPIHQVKKVMDMLGGHLLHVALAW